MKKILNAILFTVNDYRSIIPRLIVGLIFLSEGTQKFLFPDTIGAGRFQKIGFHDPEFTAAFVAVFEISCGILILTGFLTRLAAIPLFIIMLTAISTTKIPIFHENGFWAMVHEARVDFSMTLLLAYLFIFGAGRPSLDRMVLDGLDGL